MSADLVIEHQNYAAVEHVDRLRAAQRDWSAQSVRSRSVTLRRFAAALAERATALHGALTPLHRRTLAETIASEILPLATAAQWNAANARRVLRSRRIKRRGLNPFLGRLQATTYREPLGVVMIVGAWNYPIFLPGCQMIQALVAGNAVVVKPAARCYEVTRSLVDMLVAAGVPKGLIHVAGCDAAEVLQHLDAGVDLVVLTASNTTGRIVASAAAQRLIPTIAELSGCDALVVLPGADLSRVVDAVCFAMTLNGGATCMAPRRLIASDAVADQLLELLKPRLGQLPPARCTAATREKLAGLVSSAQISGACVLHGSLTSEDQQSSDGEFSVIAPVVVDGVEPAMELATADIFAPLLFVLRVPTTASLDEDVGDREQESRIVELVSACPYALTASIFGPAAQAHRLARRLDVGVVTINDLIAPTVEPSIGFGGRRASGYGSTRGEEGLRQLTREKSIVLRQGKFLPHLQPPSPTDDMMLDGLLRWMYAGKLRERLAGLRRMIQAGRGRRSTSR